MGSQFHWNPLLSVHEQENDSGFRSTRQYTRDQFQRGLRFELGQGSRQLVLTPDAKDLINLVETGPPLTRFATLLYFHGDASPSLLIGCPLPRPNCSHQFRHNSPGLRAHLVRKSNSNDFDSFSFRFNQIEEFMDKTGLPHARWTMDQDLSWLRSPNRLSQDTVQALEFIPASDELSGQVRERMANLSPFLRCSRLFHHPVPPSLMPV